MTTSPVGRLGGRCAMSRSALITAERASNRFVAGLGARKMWLRLRGQGHDVAAARWSG
jgi:hypothetical protein